MAKCRSLQPGCHTYRTILPKTAATKSFCKTIRQIAQYFVAAPLHHEISEENFSPYFAICTAKLQKALTSFAPTYQPLQQLGGGITAEVARLEADNAYIHDAETFKRFVSLI